MSKRQGTIKAFHNISTNSSNINIDGVTVEDLLSIIRDLMNKHGSEKWKILADDLYKHIVNRNNPHHFTIEQLDQNVLDVLYKQWLDEGYIGTKQEFIDIFFQYIDIADLDDMDLVIEGTSETHVPVVAVLAEYIKLHDKNLQAHEELFKSKLGSNEEFVDTKFTPTFAVSRMCNIGLKNFYAYQTGTVNYSTTYNITTAPVDLNDYPLAGIESSEGLFLIQCYKNAIVGGTSLPGSSSAPMTFHFSLRPVIDSDTNGMTSRYLTLRVCDTHIGLVYRDHTAPVSDNYHRQFITEHNFTGPIVNVGITLNRDNTVSLFFGNEKYVLGTPNSMQQKLNSFLRIRNILKFPEQIDNVNDYLTLGCAYFVGSYSDAQVRHLLTSYWPNPS